MIEPEIFTEVEGRVGRLRLNRPGALNALTIQMLTGMTEALLAWRDDPAVDLVLLDHAGPRGFCAGGDIRQLVKALAEDSGAAKSFFLPEYRLNTLMTEYAKPIVSVMDGVVMGGGAGIGLPARYRVATERTMFAMPEVAIGLFPDVGSGWRLPRMPGRLGWWLALTGGRIGPADCLLTGVATHFVESARAEALKAAIIAEPAAIERILSEFAADAGHSALADHRDAIDAAFGHDSVEGIIAALEAQDTDWAREQLAVIATRSPFAMKIAFRLLERGPQMASFAQNMAVEYALALRVTALPDFREGVRAMVIDKDNRPQWRPGTLAEVSETDLAAIFEPLPSSEAWTPLP